MGLLFAFLHGGLAGETNFAGLFVDSDAFDPNRFAHLDHILGPADSHVGQLADVTETFFTGEALNETAELLDAGDPALVDLAVFDLGAAAAEGVDFLHRAIHGVGVVRVDEDLAGVVFGDVNLRSGRFDDATNGLSARPDEQTDLFRIDLDRLNPGSVLREVFPGRIERTQHGLEDLDPGFAGLVNGDLGDFERQPVDFEVELEAGDALGGAGQLEVHVTEVIFFTQDVGDGRPLRD